MSKSSKSIIVSTLLLLSASMAATSIASAASTSTASATSKGSPEDFPYIKGEARSAVLQADSLPQGWTDVPESVQEIPGGESDGWWRRFSDPLLDLLISLGVERNYNLAIAHRRMEIARASMQRAKSGWYPTVGVEAGWSKEHPSGATGPGKPSGLPSDSYFNAGLTAQWEIDIFGKVSAGVKAEKAAYRASREEYAATMVSMAAQIASAYFQLRVNQRLLAVAESHCERQMKIVKMAQARFEASLASKLDVAQAWQTYYSTASSVPGLRAAVVAGINSLGVLTGMFPQEAAAMLAVNGPLPNWQMALPAVVPADLLRRRPDIRAAEQQLARAAAEVGVAKKDFLPTLSIEGGIGTRARDIGNLFGDHSLYWSVAPTLSWTLFDGFARRYSVASARESMMSAIDSYNLAVMTAVGETDTALNAYGEALDRIGLEEKFCVQNEEALRLAVERYRDSLSPMTDVVNAQLNALAGECDLVQAQGSALSALVTLYEALGGGVDAPAE